MITKNSMQLKAYIKKVATEKNLSAQIVMQNYMMGEQCAQTLMI